MIAGKRKIIYHTIELSEDDIYRLLLGEDVDGDANERWDLEDEDFMPTRYHIYCSEPKNFDEVEHDIKKRRIEHEEEAITRRKNLSQSNNCGRN